MKRILLFASCLLVATCIAAGYSVPSYAQDPIPPPPPPEPDPSVRQLVIFDGTTDAEATLVVTDDYIGVPPFDFVVSWLDPARSLDPISLPDPLDFENVCIALDRYSEIEDYMQQACSAADSLLANILACEAYRQSVVAAINMMLDDAGVPERILCHLPTGLPADTSFPASPIPTCSTSACEIAMSMIHTQVEALNNDSSTCEQFRDDVVELFFTVQTALSGTPDPDTIHVLACVRELLEDIAAHAAFLLESANRTYDFIQTQKSACDLAALQDACEDCGGFFPDPLLGPVNDAVTLPMPTGSVQESDDAAATVDGIVSTLALAAGQANDPALAAQIADIAGRLGDDSVKQKFRLILVRSASPETRMFVAINPDADAKLDVVILTFLAFDPNAPSQNIADETMLFDAFNLFAGTLAPTQ